jgi:hypothetical protein
MSRVVLPILCPRSSANVIRSTWTVTLSGNGGGAAVTFCICCTEIGLESLF